MSYINCREDLLMSWKGSYLLIKVISSYPPPRNNVLQIAFQTCLLMLPSRADSYCCYCDRIRTRESHIHLFTCLWCAEWKLNIQFWLSLRLCLSFRTLAYVMTSLKIRLTKKKVYINLRNVDLIPYLPTAEPITVAHTYNKINYLRTIKYITYVQLK